MRYLLVKGWQEMARKNAEERFWKYVDRPDGCWNWKGGKAKGYGALSIGRGKISAHRFSWELHNGPVPDGMFVLHSCDNPACVNPAHLWLGTNQDNMTDKMEKDRGNWAIGEDNGRAKVTEETVLKMRADYPGKTQKQIADEHGVSQAQVSQIVRRKTWTHI